MECAIRIKIEALPEGLYLATSEELDGLVAQGRTVAEALEIARDVAKKLLEAQRERGDLSSFQPASERPEFAIAVGD
jgi:predicted RNase H-like HicB family nuclease